MKGSPLCPNTIGLLKWPTMYAFFGLFLIGPAVQSCVVCRLQILRCLEWFQDSSRPISSLGHSFKFPMQFILPLGHGHNSMDSPIPNLTCLESPCPLISSLNPGSEKVTLIAIRGTGETTDQSASCWWGASDVAFRGTLKSRACLGPS
jgi:hypothetical protein